MPDALVTGYDIALAAAAALSLVTAFDKTPDVVNKAAFEPVT